MTTGAGSSSLPEDIVDAVKCIRTLQDKKFLTREERENLNRAKLRVAYWACRSENIVASRDNLAYVLGSDATEIMNAYDKYLERDEKNKKAKDERKRREGGTKFWGDA